MTPAEVHGHVDPAFAAVRDAFERNFTETFEHDDPGARRTDPGDLGASCCVIVGGRVVVDLWGGWADRARTRPWQADTLVNAYSVGKAVTAATVLSVVADGLIDLDAPLSDVWPEFAAHDKGAITLRMALAHQAGLPAVDRPIGEDEVLDFSAIAAALADTAPWWEPGTAHGYHVNTLGHVVGEPVVRVTGRSIGAEVRRRVAEPTGADVWIGLPATEHRRVAEIDFFEHLPDELLPHGGDTPLDRLRRATYFNPQAMSGIGVVNTAGWRSAEVPSTNLHASARGVARVFAALIEPAAPIVPAALVAEAATTHSLGHDLILDRESHFGLAMMLHQEGRPIGLSERSFGHYGNGGSLGFADPTAGVAFGYVLNRPGDRWQVPRSRRLIAALRRSLGA